MSGPDLVAYLRERLDEEEAMARETADLDARYPTPGPARWVWARQSEGGHGFYPGAPSPARVLAEVAAKRAILDLHPPVYRPSGAWCATCGDWPSPGDEQGEVMWPCPTLLALAQSYADRPGFDSAWRTDG